MNERPCRLEFGTSRLRLAKLRNGDRWLERGVVDPMLSVCQRGVSCYLTPSGLAGSNMAPVLGQDRTARLKHRT